MPVNVDRLWKAIDIFNRVKELQDVNLYQRSRAFASWYRIRCTFILILSITEKIGTKLPELISIKEQNTSLLMEALLNEL